MSRPAAIGVALSVLLAVGACSSSSQEDELEWVAALRPGDCVDPGRRVTTEVVRMRVIHCDKPHSMEVYARLPYPGTETASASPTPSVSPSASPPSVASLFTSAPAASQSSSTEYPGRDALRGFAREACAENFRAYLGANPREPWYFLTYLFPSVASWTSATAKRPKLGPLTRLVTSSVRSDRSVVCFLRTTGPPLKASVRDVTTPSTAKPTAPAKTTAPAKPTAPAKSATSAVPSAS